MNRIIFSLFSLETFALLSTDLLAQDIIILRDQCKIEAIVTEVSSSTIKCCKYNNQTGPSFILELSKIASILYANGEVTTFEKETSNNDTQQVEPLRWKKGTTTFRYNGYKIGSEDMRNVVSQSKPELLQTFDEGVAKMNTYDWLMGCGGTFFLLGATCALSGLWWWGWSLAVVYAGAGTCLVGGILMLCSIPSYKSGTALIKTFVNDFNSGNVRQSYAMNMSFGVTHSGGVGIMLNF